MRTKVASLAVAIALTVVVTCGIARLAGATTCCQFPGLPRSCTTPGTQVDCDNANGTWYTDRFCNGNTGLCTLKQNLPGLSQWGVLALGVVLFGTAAFVIGRRRSQAF